MARSDSIITSGKKALSVNAQVYNAAVRHAIFLERLKTQEARQIIGFLNKNVYPDIVARIEARLSRIASRGHDVGPSTMKGLRDTFSAIRGIIDAGMDESRTAVTGMLVEAAKVEAASQAAIVNRALPSVIAEGGVAFAVPSSSLLRAIVRERPFEGRLLKDWFKGLAASTQTKVQTALNVGLVQGESVPDLVRRIRGTAANNFTDGVIQASRREVEAVVRTAVNHVVTQAREVTYEENGELIKGVQFVATLDSRTTPQCRALDGKVFPVGEGPRPPIHFNCRSTTVPVLKSWKELGFDIKDVDPAGRASMNGVVPASTTYGEWLRSQSREIQDETLGPERAKLFRSGQVTIDRFVDDRNRPLTLDQIRAREGLK